MTSIPDYIQQLDADQLEHVVELASKRLQAKRDETKVVLWAVESRSTRIQICRSYLEAVERLHEQAIKWSSAGQNGYEVDRPVGVARFLVAESEVEEWLHAI
ncbi:MAG: hypothetical protein NVV69_16270 [Methyloversatilis sp.]|uniref:hypothetical protein n=1 Tax=Methyloversatilis sp. TaxID=2569862 RepID=UPI0025E8C880|nr:hypothetical protein [Methyloversatilis sp.]MCR6667522.1 hypothetical protein [Methyloversatilis sp.]